MINRPLIKDTSINHLASINTIDINNMIAKSSMTDIVFDKQMANLALMKAAYCVTWCL